MKKQVTLIYLFTINVNVLKDIIFYNYIKKKILFNLHICESHVEKKRKKVLQCVCVQVSSKRTELSKTVTWHFTTNYMT